MMSELNQNSQIVVVRVIDDLTLVLNKGSEHGISKGDTFLVYYVEPEEIKDPVTGESLGNLEIVRGSGSVVHVQPKMCTIKSNRTESGGRIIRRASSGALAAIMGETIEHPEKQAIPFDYPQVGDIAKPV
jgi:hypothetical protein